MAIGDLVLYQGRRYRLLGIDPMSVTDRRAELEDLESGAHVRVLLDEVEPMQLGKGDEGQGLEKEG